jgi:hypothetical protein
MLLKKQRDARKKVEVVTNVAFIYEDEQGRPLDTSKPHASPWSGDTETLVRILYVPDGMNEMEARRITDGSTTDL